MSRFLTKKVSPARRRNPTGAINVRSSSPRKLYSTFADQLGAKAHSMPAPTSQPLLLLLEAVIDAPVVRLVTSTSSRISSETSERPSVSSRNLCSRSKSSCTMMWSEIIRGAKIRFDFTLSVPLFVLFGWRHEPAHPLPTFSLRTVVICRLFSSHEETSEIPLSSSIVLRRFPPNRETTRSILVRDALAFVGKCAASS